jgi:SAM-dependent methyltransferase
LLTDVPADLGRYYAQDGYGTAADATVKAFVEREEAKLALVTGFVKGGAMVEIGPGAGVFTRVAKVAGFDVTAIEMDPHYCEVLRNEIGVEVVQSEDPAEVLPSLSHADVVVMWHVIEHLADPWAVLAASVERLGPGGVLAVSTPNPDSLQARLLKRRWAHLDAPRHLQLIPADTLRMRVERLGASHVLTTTMDPVGLECNRLGWEYAVRLHPAKHPSTAVSMRAGSLLTRAVSPVERHGMLGAAYTSLFLQAGPGD